MKIRDLKPLGAVLALSILGLVGVASTVSASPATHQPTTSATSCPYPQHLCTGCSGTNDFCAIRCPECPPL